MRSGRNFSATLRSSSSSRASQTIPIPPRPRILTSVKRPKTLSPLANSHEVAAAISPARSLVTLANNTLWQIIHYLRCEGTLKLRGQASARHLRIRAGSQELAPPRKTLCFQHDFLVKCFGVNAPLEEGAWLEAADGRRHPIHGSCSL